jgi:hypothetical protein
MAYTRKHIIAMISGLLIALSCGILSKTYRPYIYENHINDFHLADTIPNWLAVPAVTLFLWGLSKGKIYKYNFKMGIVCSAMSIVFFEFILSATFDYWDLIATILSGGVTFCIYMIYKYSQNRNT